MLFILSFIIFLVMMHRVSGWFLLGVIGMILSVFGVNFTVHETGRTNYYREIYTLKTGQELHGQFCLGSGSINSSNCYYFYVKDERGGYIINTSDVGDTYLFEKNDTVPNVSWQTIHYDTNRWVFPFNMARDKNTKVDIVVPVGTIIKEYHGY